MSVRVIDNNSGGLTAPVDATNIADGSVSDAEFQRLNGVTSSIQSQIDDKANTSHTHSESEITDLDKYTQAETDNLLDDKVDKDGAKVLSDNNYTTTEKNKLSGIESGATADQTAGEIKTAYESNANTNAFTDTEKTKLAGVADNATANPNAFDKTSDDLDDISEGTTNKAFTNTLKNKLDNIEANAQVNTVTSVASKTGAVDLVKGDVGLGNVDNTSDANKPISSATQTALNGKANTSHTHSASNINSGTMAKARLPSDLVLQAYASSAVSWDGLPPPTIIADSSGTYVDYTVTGAQVGQRVNATLRGVTESNIVVRAEVISTNTVRVHYAKISGTADLTEKIVDISVYFENN